MLNFIIYEDEEKYRDKYFSVIDKFIGGSKLAYEVIELKKYSKEEFKKLEKASGESKIYILDAEVPGKSGLDFAREIRDSGDWDSQIILVTEHPDLRNYDYQRKILMLGFITKFFNMERDLLEAIEIAHNILTSREVIQFQKNGEIYRIPVKQILFIEKKQEEVYCQIHTKKESYIVNKTLIQMEKSLKNDPRFMKVHRNYIVNTYNIRKVDCDDLVIEFENEKVAFLSKNYKKKLKERLIKNQTDNEDIKC